MLMLQALGRLFGIAIGIAELALEIRKLGRQGGQNVHAIICGADEPLPHFEAFRDFEDTGGLAGRLTFWY